MPFIEMNCNIVQNYCSFSYFFQNTAPSEGMDSLNYIEVSFPHEGHGLIPRPKRWGRPKGSSYLFKGFNQRLQTGPRMIERKAANCCAAMSGPRGARSPKRRSTLRIKCQQPHENQRGRHRARHLLPFRGSCRGCAAFHSGCNGEPAKVRKQSSFWHLARQATLFLRAPASLQELSYTEQQPAIEAKGYVTGHPSIDNSAKDL